MSRYFFHIHDAGKVIKDDEGGEFGSVEEATGEAYASARDIVVDCMRRHASVGAQGIEIMDERGESLLMLPVLKVVT